MKVLWVLCVLFGGLANGYALDREAFSFTKYALEVRLEPEQHRLGARGTITLRNDSSSPQKNVVLQISSALTWRSIQAEGKPLQFVSQPYESDVDHTGELSEAIVTLPKEVPPGGTVDLTIGYEGVVALDATRLTCIGIPKEAAIHSDWDQLSEAFSAVRGIGNVVWYPIASESANLSDGNSVFETLGRWKQREQNAEMKIRFRHSRESAGRPPALLCSSATPRFVQETSPGEEMVAECAFPSIGFRVPSFVMADYDVLDGSRIQIFYRQDQRRTAEKFAQAAEAVAPFVSQWFGAPREKVRIAELFDPGASPFETGSMLLTPFGDADPKLLQVAMVHELTHATFFSNRPWIYEGLAHFSQALYRESQESRQAAIDFLALHGDATVAAEKAVAARPKAQTEESLISTSIDEFYRSKAAYVWWMLRDMVGDETLKKVLASYHTEEDKDPTYLQHLFEAQFKQDLQWFFDDWVYKDSGLPDFRVESAFPRQASQDNYLVTVTVENLGMAGAEVPVIVRFAGGELTRRVEVRGKGKAVVRVATPKPPAEIVVNDGSVPESDTSNNVFKVENGKP
jgi:hypothetical protein